MTDVLCSSRIQLVVFSQDVEERQLFGVTQVRKYDFQGEDRKKRKLDYHRQFYFVELKELKNANQFDYSFMIDDQILEKKYSFRTRLLEGSDYSMMMFGDHDLEKGMEMIGYIQKNKPDLLLLLGDYAYDMQDENGERGEVYFQEMEQVFTMQPVIFVPGNHEVLD